MRVAAPGMDARGLVAELRTRVMAEVDYRQEAAAQTAFAEEFRDDPDFAVPAVVAGTDRVLVTDWIDGTPLAQVARSGSAHDRERTALCTVRFLLSSPPRVGRLHGDPHPGNFRLLGDGRLAVLDFGSSLPMPHGWPPRLAALLRAGRDRDSAALFEVARATGLVAAADVTPEVLLALLDPLLDPLRQETFTFDRAWMRAQTARVSDPRSEVARTQRKHASPSGTYSSNESQRAPPECSACSAPPCRSGTKQRPGYPHRPDRSRRVAGGDLRVTPIGEPAPAGSWGASVDETCPRVTREDGGADEPGHGRHCGADDDDDGCDDEPNGRSGSSSVKVNVTRRRGWRRRASLRMARRC